MYSLKGGLVGSVGRASDFGSDSLASVLRVLSLGKIINLTLPRYKWVPVLLIMNE